MYREEMCFRKRDFSPGYEGEFNFLEIRGKKKKISSTYFYTRIITRWIHCFGLRRNIFALTCDPKCVGEKKKRGGKNILDGEKEKKNWEKNKYKNIQEKEDLIFFFSFSLCPRGCWDALFFAFGRTRGLKFNYGARTGLITRDSEGFSGPVSHASNIFPLCSTRPRKRHLSRFNDRLEPGITVDR